MFKCDTRNVHHKRNKMAKGGGIGIFGFADLANFWFGFSVFALKNCGFPVLVFRAVCGFSPI